MNRFAWREEDLLVGAALAKHLKGKHDQKTHRPKGVGADYEIESSPLIEELAQTRFGLSLKQVAALTGAPDGAKVLIHGGTVSGAKPPADVRLNASAVRFRKIEGTDSMEQLEVNVTLLNRLDGKRELHNRLIRIKNMRAGTGTEIAVSQLRAAREAKVDVITLTAAGQAGSGKWNGYYTWARLGWNGKVQSTRGTPYGKTTHEIMSTPEGRDWWRNNGTEFDGEFDTRPSSRSSRILESYARSKGLWKAARLRGDFNLLETFPLTADDEAILDRAWYGGANAVHIDR